MRNLSKALIAATCLAVAAPAAAAPPASAPAPAPAPAAPKPAGATGDVRCLMAMFALSQQKDRQAATAGALGVYFFAGRISTRAPTLNLSEAMRAEALTMQGPQIQVELQRCGPAFQAATQRVQAALAPFRSQPSASPPAGAPPAPAPAPQPK